MLYLADLAKDRDPNTVGALEMEPLPFDGMSTYLCGPDERFPDAELHRNWCRE